MSNPSPCVKMTQITFVFISHYVTLGGETINGIVYEIRDQEVFVSITDSLETVFLIKLRKY